MEKIKMTNNEYQKFLKANADKIWNKNINYSYQDYCKDADNVEILPFDLSKYNLPKDIEKNINNCFSEDHYNKDNEYVLEGSAISEEQWYKITDKLNLKRVTGYYYSGYCYNNEFNFYMTYCEGDLYLHLFEDKESYKKSLEKTIKWYDEN